GYGLPATLALTLATGIVCGLWNGALVAFLGIQPIIATLILMVAGRGIAQLITEGVILTFNDQGLIFVGSGILFGVPMPVVLWILIALAVGLAVRFSALGMLIEAVGVNRRAAYLSGVGTAGLLLAVYALSGFCAAIAGTIAAADIRGADANNAGLWLELDAILAVVIGGNSLLGGRFSIVGSLVGAMIIQSINTGILLSGYPPEFNLVIKAVIIVAILVLQSPTSRAFLAFAWRKRSSASQEAAGQQPAPGRQAS
ncbi:MAG: ABC transporter permease, partial [Fulvimarina manganoxydans]